MLDLYIIRSSVCIYREPRWYTFSAFASKMRVIGDGCYFCYVRGSCYMIASTHAPYSSCNAFGVAHKVLEIPARARWPHTGCEKHNNKNVYYYNEACLRRPTPTARSGQVALWVYYRRDLAYQIWRTYSNWDSKWLWGGYWLLLLVAQPRVHIISIMCLSVEETYY